MKHALMLKLCTTALAVSAAPEQNLIPANDSFAARIRLFGTNTIVTGSNVGATREIGEPDVNFTGGRSVWWTWTAPRDGGLIVTTAGSSFDTMLTVFTGGSVTNLSLVAFNDTETNISRVNFNVAAGREYQIAVDGSDGTNSTGPISLQLTLGPVQPPPANDNFANRITLSGSQLNNVTGTNVGATKELGEPFHADAIGEKSVWWSWTAPASGGLTVSTQGSEIDTVLAIYTGNALSNLQVVAANDEGPAGFESRVTCNVISNVTYQIAVDGLEGDSGSIRLRFSLGAAIPVPANDQFANRITLPGGSSVTSGSNVGASLETDEPMHLVTWGGKSVWWKWTAPASGSVMLTTSNSAIDTLLAVYRGTALNNLTFVAGNDEASDFDYTSLVFFNATFGTTYNIAVDGYDGDSGAISLRLVLDFADAVPSNNNFANRTTINGIDTTVNGSNIGATLEAGEPLHRGYYGGSSVWWRWTSPASGYVTIDTINSVPDTLLAVYTGSSLEELIGIASDDNSGGGTNYNSLVSFHTKGNVTYAIAVDGYDGDAGAIRLRVRFSEASYSLTVTANLPETGSVNLDPLPDQDGKYSPGSVVTVTATAAPGSIFTGWAGDVSGTNNPLVLPMNANKTLTANFYVLPTMKVWSGQSAESGQWTDVENWSNGVPIAGDVLIFPSGAARRASNTNEFPIHTTFKSIIFLDEGYVLRGNPLSLNNGIIASNATGANRLELNVQVNSNQTFRGAAGAELAIAGDLDLQNRTVTFEVPDLITLYGVLTGTGGIIKNGHGTLLMTGGADNTYNGATLIQEGTLVLERNGVAITGPLIIGDDLGGVDADLVQFTRSQQLAGTCAVTIRSSGRLDLNGFSGSVGSVLMTGGTLSTGTGSLGLNGDVTVNPSSMQSTIAGNLALLGATRIFDVGNGVVAIDLLVSATIADGAGTAGLTKTGAGTVGLSSPNTYTGKTTVDDGILVISDPLGLGAPTQGTVVNQDGLLALSTSVHGEMLTMAGGILEATTASNAWTADISFDNDSTVVVRSNATLNLTGVLHGPAGVTKAGDGLLIFSGPSNNTYGGPTAVEQGTLFLSKTSSNAVPGALIIGDAVGGPEADVARLGADQQISPTAAVTIRGSGLLDLQGSSAWLGSLAGNGNITVGATAILGVGHGGASGSFAGTIQGAGGLRKVGGGALVLSGNNTYLGPTLVNDGWLFVEGTQPASAVTVELSALLGGTGRVGDVSGPGTISPGLSPGVLSSGNVTFSSNTVFRAELDGNAAGSGYDQLKVTGTVHLAGTLEVTVGVVAVTQDSFIIVDNDGEDPVVDSFSGLTEGSFFLIGERVFQITYRGGTGSNDVVLRHLPSTAPTMSPPLILANGAAQLEGLGLGGLGYVLEAAPTLDPITLWVPLGTNTADATGLFRFVDQEAFLFPTRFYRTRRVPLQ